MPGYRRTARRGGTHLRMRLLPALPPPPEGGVTANNKSQLRRWAFETPVVVDHVREKYRIYLLSIQKNTGEVDFTLGGNC